MPEWMHLECGSVFSGKVPPFDCPICGFGQLITGWKCLGPTPASQTRNGKHRKAKIGPQRRLNLYRRDRFRCVKCGSTDDLTLDHIIPRSKGGTNQDDNLQTMCDGCNQAKADRAPR